MDQTTIIILSDWLGSLLMLGSVWGWLYQRIASPIKERFERSDRRFFAIMRLLLVRVHTDKDITKYRALKKQWGADKMDDYVYNVQLSALLIRKLAQTSSPEEWKEFAQLQRRTLSAFRKLAHYVPSILFYFAKRGFFGVTDAITSSLFTGALGKLIFLLGFLLWNTSKVLSLVAK